MNRAGARALLTEYVKDQSLVRHCLAVEAAMRAYARKLGQDEEEWGVVGLLHDFDYERWPDPPDHPLKGSEILRQYGYPESVTQQVKFTSNEASSIYYTLDGSTPTTASTEWKPTKARALPAAIAIADDATLKWIATDFKGNVSAASSKTFMIETDKPTATLTGFTEGQRVAVNAVTPCYRCSYCQRGFTSQCGGALGGYKYTVQMDGNMADYFVVPAAARQPEPAK